MPRTIHDDDENDDWDDDSDWPADAEYEDNDYTVPCPYCKRTIHEDAQRCPYCERYISEEDVPRQRKPWWIIAGALLAFYAVYRWVAG